MRLFARWLCDNLRCIDGALGRGPVWEQDSGRILELQVVLEGLPKFPMIVQYIRQQLEDYHPCLGCRNSEGARVSFPRELGPKFHLHYWALLIPLLCFSFSPFSLLLT